MQLSELQKSVELFSKEKGFDKSTIEQRTLFLVTEVGEVIKEILKISYNPNHKDLEKIKENLGNEIYDVIWNLCDLASKLDIDVTESAIRKQEFNKDRHWD